MLRPRQQSESIDLSLLSVESLRGLSTIDMTGFGANRLTIHASQIVTHFDDAKAIVVAHLNDTVLFVGNWRFDGNERTRIG